VPPRWCAEGILQPRAVQGTGPTSEHPRMGVLAVPRVKHAPDQVRGRVELNRRRQPVLSRDPGTSRGAPGLALARQEPRRFAPPSHSPDLLLRPIGRFQSPDWSWLGTRPKYRLSVLAEDADRDALVVDIETDVKHGCRLKSMYLWTAANEFQVTQLAGASFMVSTPKLGTRAGVRLAAIGKGVGLASPPRRIPRSPVPHFIQFITSDSDQQAQVCSARTGRATGRG
jgi:hypothetical protein